MSVQTSPRQEPFWLQFLWVTHSCTIVLLVSLVIGWTLMQMFYSFWFYVSLFAFTPIWLWCFGLVMRSRFRFFPMLVGVLISLLLMSYFALGDVEPLKARLQMASGLSLAGALCMSAGACLNWFFSLFKSGSRPLRKDRPIST